MNLKKNLGRVATAFLATAMLASLTAVPVSADPIENPDLGTGGDGSAGSAVISSINGNGTLGQAGGNPLTEMEFDKVLMLPDDVAIPDVTFTFTLRAATEEEVGDDEVLTDDAVRTSEVYPGIPYENTTIDKDTGKDGVQVQVTFGSGDEDDRDTARVPNADGGIANVDMVGKTVEFTGLDDIAFTDAGVYKYILHEEALTSADRHDYTLSGDRIVYVNVERVVGTAGVADTYKITGISMVKVDAEESATEGYIVPLKDEEDGTLAKADGNIYNFYMLEDPDPNEPGGTPDDPEGEEDPKDDEETGDPDDTDPDDPVPVDHNAYVVKTVDGAMGNYNDDFEFTVTLTTQKQNKNYKAYLEKLNETTNEWEQITGAGITNPITITANTEVTGSTGVYQGTATINLSHNERLRIAGVSAAAGDGADAVPADTYAAKEKDYKDTGYTTKIDRPGTMADVTTATNGYYDSESMTFTKDAGGAKDTNVATFTNTRDAVSPTGIAMNVAPYALLVVVAAAGCFVFLRKRREDD